MKGVYSVGDSVHSLRLVTILLCGAEPLSNRGAGIVGNVCEIILNLGEQFGGRCRKRF